MEPADAKSRAAVREHERKARVARVLDTLSVAVVPPTRTYEPESAELERAQELARAQYPTHLL